MQAILSAYKPSLDAYVCDYLKARRTEITQINKWHDDVYDRLEQFVTQGKSVRGCLFLWALQTYQGDLRKEDYALAASFELIHSGLLIHDDIMDNDRDRRGKPTLYAQYENIAINTTAIAPESLGKNLAICAGDLAIFHGMDCLVSSDSISHGHSAICREYASVCIAQMQDVSFGTDASVPSVDEVLSMYLYKTARYTIMLPLREGARFGKASEADIAAHEAIGQKIGLVFQLADDLLNLYGDPKKTGKPTGSDIREGKKTFAYVSLLNELTQIEKQSIHESRDADTKINLVMALMETHKIREKIRGKCESLITESESLISQLHISDKAKNDLLHLIRFVFERES